MLVNDSNSTISGPTASSLGDYFAGASMEYQVNLVIMRKRLSANFMITPPITVKKMNITEKIMQAAEMITKTPLVGLLTRHNTLKRHLYLMGLSDSPLCRRHGTEDETSVHILCECEALAKLRHEYLGSFFLEPEDIKNISLGAIYNFGKVTGLP
jgi:hypothetical protein